MIYKPKELTWDEQHPSNYRYFPSPEVEELKRLKIGGEAMNTKLAIQRIEELTARINTKDSNILDAGQEELKSLCCNLVPVLIAENKKMRDLLNEIYRYGGVRGLDLILWGKVKSYLFAKR